ncbi:hypothetical protein SEA_GALACTICA_93 [Streptomyces phage Galactica]|nr:hypothetical protein SEA_GALACTICA_93 [Streptomyces phage Galactica]
MAIKILKEAGFVKGDHVLTIIRRGSEVLGDVAVRDLNRELSNFGGSLPIDRALDMIRCSHNADIINGVNNGTTLPKTPEVQAALARAYEVAHLV